MLPKKIALTPTIDSGHMDNRPRHKVEGVRKAIKTASAVPPYSPNLNPIEQAFAKLKAFLRKAAARTVDDLWQTIADGLEQLDTEECANSFQNSDYAPYLCSLSILKRSSAQRRRRDRLRP